jgi:hypothetical protein
MVLIASSLAIVLLAFALAREVRLRRALQRLLARLLFMLRRKRNGETPSTGGEAPGSVVDRDDRMSVS